MDDLGAKLEQERRWDVGILRTMADKLEGLSLDDLAKPLTLVMGPVQKLDEWIQKLWKRRRGAFVVR